MCYIFWEKKEESSYKAVFSPLIEVVVYKAQSGWYYCINDAVVGGPFSSLPEVKSRAETRVIEEIATVLSKLNGDPKEQNLRVISLSARLRAMEMIMQLIWRAVRDSTNNAGNDRLEDVIKNLVSRLNTPQEDFNVTVDSGEKCSPSH